MPITTDMIIFADKYHNKQHLPDDLIKMIMHINTEEIKAEKQTKKKYQSVIDVFDDHRVHLNQEEEDNENTFNDCINSMLGIRYVNALDDFIDYIPICSFCNRQEEDMMDMIDGFRYGDRHGKCFKIRCCEDCMLDRDLLPCYECGCLDHCDQMHQTNDGETHTDYCVDCYESDDDE